MPGEKPSKRVTEPRSVGIESGDREGRILARASGIAAAVALASMGLAYVTAQAGISDQGTLAGGGPPAEETPEVSAPVPEVDSPTGDSKFGDGDVLVQEDSEEPSASQTFAAPDGTGDSEPVWSAPRARGGSEPPDERDGREERDDEPAPTNEETRDPGTAPEPLLPPAPDPEPAPEPGEEPPSGTDEWTRWWEAQREAWEDAWGQWWPGRDSDSSQLSILDLER